MNIYFVQHSQIKTKCLLGNLSWLSNLVLFLLFLHVRVQYPGSWTKLIYLTYFFFKIPKFFFVEVYTEKLFLGTPKCFALRAKFLGSNWHSLWSRSCSLWFNWRFFDLANVHFDLANVPFDSADIPPDPADISLILLTFPLILLTFL